MRLTGQQLAHMMAYAIDGRLGLPFGGNVAPGCAGERLAREYREGLGGLMDHLWQQAAVEHPNGAPVTAMLLEVWVKQADQVDLVAATGRTRDQWLALT